MIPSTSLILFRVKTWCYFTSKLPFAEGQLFFFSGCFLWCFLVLWRPSVARSNEYSYEEMTTEDVSVAFWIEISRVVFFIEGQPH